MIVNKKGVGMKRENNFNVIRFVAALMVMAGHMAYICGTSVPLFLGEGVQALGVKIFFLAGGFLISKSWIADPSPKKYAIKRIMRIFPALIVYCILVTFVFGPILSTLSVKEYFSRSEIFVYLKNIFLYPIYSLPGVFGYNPYPNAVNGSLWTLPVEVTLYMIVPIVIIIFGLHKKNNKSLTCIVVFTAFLCVCQMIRLKYFPSLRFVIYGTDIVSAFDLVPWYFIGMIYTYPCIQRRLNIQISMILILLLSCIPADAMMTNVLKYLAFPYIVFSFVLIEKPLFSMAFRKCEISYGVYLYSFFVQQSVVYIAQMMHCTMGYLGYYAVSIIATCIFAFASAKLVEEPAQKFCKYLIKNIN